MTGRLGRREFIWTAGAAAGAFALWPMDQVSTSPRSGSADPGWSPGIEERIRSACALCPSHCGVTGRVVDGRLVRIMGNPLHPMSAGGLCPRGVAGVQMLYHPERLSSPLLRVGARGSGEWRRIAVEDALARLSDRLRELRAGGRPHALAAISSESRGTMNAVWRQFFRAFGSPNFVAADHPDGTDAVMQVVHGIARRPAYDLERSDLVLSFGAPLFESWWSPLQAFTAFARPGVERSADRRFIQVDHRFSRTAAYADEWVGVNARTHAVLALGMAYVILRDRLYDEAFLQRHVSGFEDFTDAGGRPREGFRSLVLARYRTEEVAATTGVPVERITSLARAFAAVARPVALCGSDVTRAPDGLSAAMSVHALNVLTGSINRPGGVLFGAEPPLRPLVAVQQDPVSRAGLTREPLAVPPPFGGGDAVTLLAEEAGRPAGPVELLMIHGLDPLAGSHRRDLWDRVLETVPFIVSFSPYLDETSRRADLVIPDLLPQERWQDAPAPESYPYPTWGLMQPMVEPRVGALHTGEALFAVAASIGGTVAASLPWERFADLLQDRARGLFEAHRGRSFADAFDLENLRKQEERGWWLGTEPDFESFWAELTDRGGWVDPFLDYTDPANLSRTPTGRIELMARSAFRNIEEGGAGLRVYQHGPATPDVAAEAFPLRLLPYRISTLSHAPLHLERWMAEQPGILPDVQWVPFVVLSPATARALDLADGTAVVVVSRRGRYRARLRTSPGAPPLTVCAPHGLRHPDGESADPLSILEPASDPLTGLPCWFTTFVRLEKADGGPS